MGNRIKEIVKEQKFRALKDKLKIRVIPLTLRPELVVDGEIIGSCERLYCSRQGRSTHVIYGVSSLERDKISRGGRLEIRVESN
jgi:hypothetical protein